MARPHVNAGDFCFAVWNAGHIVTDILGYKERILVDKIEIMPHRMIPSDKSLDLEVIMEDGIERANGRTYGNIRGILSDGKEPLAEISSTYRASK